MTAAIAATIHKSGKVGTIWDKKVLIWEFPRIDNTITSLLYLAATKAQILPIVPRVGH
jgi:hypothetical protein